jgi:hypothetical protein
MATFNVQGKVINENTELGLSAATVMVYQLGESDPLVTGDTDLEGNFSLDFSWPLDISIQANRPDVYFKVTQTLDGADEVVYNETPAEARTNIADVLAVTLKTTLGETLVPPTTARPYDTLFLFTRVGIIGVDEIDTVGGGASGYAHPDDNPAAPNSNSANSPFGGTLDLAAWFGEFADVYRYKIQYTTDGVTWHDVTDPLSNRYYDFGIGGGNWVTMPMGPFSEGGVNNVYKLPYIERPGQPWIYPDRIAHWDSTKVAGGLYTFRVQGFKPSLDGLSLVPSATVIIDPSYGELKLQVDNTAPVAALQMIEHQPTSGDPWVEVEVCEIVDFDSGKLRVRFEASDAAGHLESYRLTAMYGHNQTVSPRPVSPDPARDSYSNHVGPTRQWDGSNALIIEYDASGAHPHDYTPARMPTCAYQFRLDVSKRTTNGYHGLYWRQDTMHITIQRP